MSFIHEFIRPPFQYRPPGPAPEGEPASLDRAGHEVSTADVYKRPMPTETPYRLDDRGETFELYAAEIHESDRWDGTAWVPHVELYGVLYPYVLPPIGTLYHVFHVDNPSERVLMKVMYQGYRTAFTDLEVFGLSGDGSLYMLGELRHCVLVALSMFRVQYVFNVAYVTGP